VDTGLLGVQSSRINTGGGTDMIGTNLTVSGKFTGKIVWDPGSVPPEGGIR
jgi:hypothetical protein